LGLALMIGLVAVVPTSDTFASVLMGIPGSSASQATVLDGFPLSKKGEAARALSAAFASSLFGGLVGAAFLTVFILIARPVVLAFGLPEMLMVTIFGLSMVAILAGRIALKGLAAAGLGLMVGTIGEADAGGSLRMATYDFPYLIDGLKLVIVGLGIFAIPEIISLLRQDRSISEEATLGGGWVDGVRDWFANIWLSVRCSIIGVLVGVIPGLGGSVVDWIAYGHAVQSFAALLALKAQTMPRKAVVWFRHCCSVFRDRGRWQFSSVRLPCSDRARSKSGRICSRTISM